MNAVALPVFLTEKYGFGWAVGIALSIRLLPNVLLGVVAGYMVDRLQPRRVAAVSVLVGGGIVALLPLTDALLEVDLVALVVGFAYLFGLPSRLSLRPLVSADVPEMEANGVIVLFQRISAVLGPALAGALIALGGTSIVFWSEGAASLVAAALLLGMPDRIAGPGEPSASGVRRQIGVVFVDGPRRLAKIIYRDGVLRALVGSLVFYVFAIGVGQLLIVKVAETEYSQVRGGNGYLTAAMGLGGIIGAITCMHVKVHRGRAYLVATVGEALAWMIFSRLDSLVLAVVLLVGAGFAESLGAVVYFAEVQARVPAAMTGRFFATFVPLVDACTLAGTAVAPVLLGKISIGLVGAGMTVVIVGSIAPFVRVFLRKHVPLGNDDVVLGQGSGI